MDIEEIKKDTANLLKDLEALNLKYKGVLEYLALKEKEIKDKETPKEGESC